LSRSLYISWENFKKYKNYELFTGLLNKYGETSANSQDENGNTPLMNVFISVSNEFNKDDECLYDNYYKQHILNIIIQLLKAGANPYIINNENHEAIYYKNCIFEKNFILEQYEKYRKYKNPNEISNGGRIKTKRRKNKKRITRKRKNKF
jgi:hypothetical protein